MYKDLVNQELLYPTIHPEVLSNYFQSDMKVINQKAKTDKVFQKELETTLKMEETYRDTQQEYSKLLIAEGAKSKSLPSERELHEKLSDMQYDLINLSNRILYKKIVLTQKAKGVWKKKGRKYGKSGAIRELIKIVGPYVESGVGLYNDAQLHLTKKNKDIIKNYYEKRGKTKIFERGMTRNIKERGLVLTTDEQEILQAKIEDYIKDNKKDWEQVKEEVRQWKDNPQDYSIGQIQTWCEEVKSGMNSCEEHNSRDYKNVIEYVYDNYIIKATKEHIEKGIELELNIIDGREPKIFNISEIKNIYSTRRKTPKGQIIRNMIIDSKHSLGWKTTMNNNLDIIAVVGWDASKREGYQDGYGKYISDRVIELKTVGKLNKEEIQGINQLYKTRIKALWISLNETLKKKEKSPNTLIENVNINGKTYSVFLPKVKIDEVNEEKTSHNRVLTMMPQITISGSSQEVNNFIYKRNQKKLTEAINDYNNHKDLNKQKICQRALTSNTNMCLLASQGWKACQDKIDSLKNIHNLVQFQNSNCGGIPQILQAKINNDSSVILGIYDKKKGDRVDQMTDKIRTLLYEITCLFTNTNEMDHQDNIYRETIIRKTGNNFAKGLLSILPRRNIDMYTKEEINQINNLVREAELGEFTYRLWDRENEGGKITLADYIEKLMEKKEKSLKCEKQSNLDCIYLNDKFPQRQIPSTIIQAKDEYEDEMIVEFRDLSGYTLKLPEDREDLLSQEANNKELTEKIEGELKQNYTQIENMINSWFSQDKASRPYHLFIDDGLKPGKLKKIKDTI